MPHSAGGTASKSDSNKPSKALSCVAWTFRIAVMLSPCTLLLTIDDESEQRKGDKQATRKYIPTKASDCPICRSLR